MTFVTIPNRPAGGDVRAIEQILADFDAITAVVNGNLDQNNFAPGAVNAIAFMPGCIMCYGGSAAPSGWFLCNGQALSRTNYSALFAAIGSTYGAGDGSTTFNVPNMTGCVPCGPDPTGTEMPTYVPALGTRSGAESVTLTDAQMPAHAHGGSSALTDLTGHNHNATDGGGHTHIIQPSASGGLYSLATDPSGNVYASTGSGAYSTLATVHNTGGYFETLIASTTHVAVSIGNSNQSLNHNHVISNDGGGASHLNVQPFVAVNFIIKS